MSAPVSIEEPLDGNVVKFDRAEFENIKINQEWSRQPLTNPRQRKMGYSRATEASASSRAAGISGSLSNILDNENTPDSKNTGYGPILN